jgi:hypothetical protein
MTRDPGPRYDSFVLRLWRSAADDRVLQVKIDHIQTSAVYIGRDVTFEWILDTLGRAVATAPNMSQHDSADLEDDIDQAVSHK